MNSNETQNISYECMKNFFKLSDSREDKKMAEKLKRRLIREEYSNGEIICRIGEKADAMFFIESGKVEVLDKKKQQLNELDQGQYFGEYAVLTGDKRLSTVRSKGGTVVYRMKRRSVLEGIKYQPSVYGHILKQLYGQISQKHSELLMLASNRRGLVRDSKNARKMSLQHLFIHYSLVALVFLAALFLSPAENPHPAWVLLPAAFLIINMIITKRTMESIVIAILLSGAIMAKYGFVFDFYNRTLATVSDSGTMEIILILFLLGAVTRLISSSGGINALRRIILSRFKKKQSSLLMTLLCIIIIFLDDCLSLLIASICFLPVNDKQRVPREMSSFVMRIPAEAVNTLVPVSVWGVFLTGIISLSLGENGASLFYRSIPFNFASILTLAAAFLAASGKLPLIGKMKEAHSRVAGGGSLWPPRSEQYISKDDTIKRGNAINLFLPIIILVASSIASGTLGKGAFSINIGYGLIITLVFMFIFYCFQRLMTPEEYFDNIINGAESMLVPAMLLVITLCFSSGISQFAIVEWLTDQLNIFSLSVYWMLPAVLFVLFTVISALLGSSWSMWVIGLPIAIQLAVTLDINPALCVGAVCASGIAGDGLSLYQSDSLFIASVVGCEPTAMIAARFPYFVIITILTGAAYLGAGFLLI